MAAEGAWDPRLYLTTGPCDDLATAAWEGDGDAVDEAHLVLPRLTAGSYHVVVSGEGLGPFQGHFELTATFGVAAAAPVNDRCPDGIELPAAGTQVQEGTTEMAAHDFGEHDEFSPDVFYRFVLAGRTEVDARVAGESEWDTYLYLASGPCGSLEMLAENDDNPTVGWSRVPALTLDPGEYHLVVSGYSGGDFGPFLLTVTFEDAP